MSFPAPHSFGCLFFLLPTTFSSTPQASISSYPFLYSEPLLSHTTCAFFAFFNHLVLSIFQKTMLAMFEVYWDIGHPSSWELSEQVLVL